MSAASEVGATNRRAELAFAAAGAIAALVPSLVMWGFTVDDALIPIRYARHLGDGAGYRFNAGGPATDGVTPLPWAPLVAVLSRGDALDALVRVKVLGALAWTGAGAALGFALGRAAGSERRARIFAAVALAILALAFPIGAWAVSGMETGVATALATFSAVAFARPRLAALFAGVAACLRPELVPWALTLGIGSAIGGKEAARRIAACGALALAPFALCVVVRLVVFGSPAPLAVSAKPSDLSHGVTYAGAAFVVVLLPILALAPIAIARASPRAKTLTVALFVHVVVVAGVGGDWMPYARLMIPVAPALALVFVEASRTAHVASSGLRAFAAAALGIVIAWRAAPEGRRVMRDRSDLVRSARPVLRDARVIAALDVGWVGATSDAQIVDLAGLTDPSIALLAGGHTSKRVDVGMLLDRGVDTVVVYIPARWVEQRIVLNPLFATKYVETGSGLLELRPARITPGRRPARSAFARISESRTHRRTRHATC
jgi:hypothetical protein